MENITEPHCKICGDTENDGKIIKIPTQICDIYLCEFCYDVQTIYRNPYFTTLYISFPILPRKK